MGSIWLPWGFDQKAGQASVGYIRIVQFDPTEKRKMVTDFVSAFRAKYGADKTPMTQQFFTQCCTPVFSTRNSVQTGCHRPHGGAM